MDKMTQREKGRKWDGRSRISNETYKNNWNDIFGKKVIVKDLKNLLKEEKNGCTKKTNRTTD
jgi:hypothetical protein